MAWRQVSAVTYSDLYFCDLKIYHTHQHTHPADPPSINLTYFGIGCGWASLEEAIVRQTHVPH